MTEPIPLDRVLAEIRFTNIVRAESRRTIICAPEWVDQIRAAVEAEWPGLHTVVGNALLADDPSTVWVADMQCLGAGLAEMVQASRWPR